MKVGETFTFHIIPGMEAEAQSVFVNYRDIVKDLKVGDKVTVDNGLINLAVQEIRENELVCTVLDGGKLGSRKHINLPGIRVNLPSITPKDLKDILFGLEEDIDFVALSFVRSPEDVRQLRGIIEEKNHHAQIISKIEDQEGLRNLMRSSANPTGSWLLAEIWVLKLRSKNYRSFKEGSSNVARKRVNE